MNSVVLTAQQYDEGLSINFSEKYDLGNAVFDQFPMKRKRNFVNMIGNCITNLNTVLDIHNFAMGLLSIRYDMTLSGEHAVITSDVDFANRVADLFDEEIVARITSMVAAEYELNSVNIDSNHVNKNEELQFTNDHARIILIWSYSTTLVIPIITTYMAENSQSAKDATPLIMDCFGKILKRIEPENMDIFAKLRKLTESRVYQTRYSDKVIWNYLANIAIDTSIFIDKLFKRFVTDAVPKLKQGVPIIGFLHAFLKNQIQYQFMQKFLYSFKPLKHETVDSEGASPMDHLEIELIRQDESAAVIGNVMCAYAVRDISKMLKYKPSPEEVNYWSSYFRTHGINSFQQMMITKLFLPRVCNARTIKARPLQDFVIMFLLTERWLMNNNYRVLSAYMNCRVLESAPGHKLNTRKKFIREFISSDRYRELLENAFSRTSQIVIDSDVILNMISSIQSSTFVRDHQTIDTYEKVEYNINAIAQEMLRFIAQSLTE